jgi:hypothetical protein
LAGKNVKGFDGTFELRSEGGKTREEFILEVQRVAQEEDWEAMMISFVSPDPDTPGTLAVSGDVFGSPQDIRKMGETFGKYLHYSDELNRKEN